MAIRGLTVSSVQRYVSPNDEEKGNPEKETVFILKPLDVFCSTYLFDTGVNLTGEDAGKVWVYRMNLEAVRLCLTGWENFQDATGAPITFRTEKVMVCGKEYQGLPDDLLSIMPFSLIRELSDEIRKMNYVTEDEAKN
jgi:hypothetical protein